MYKRQVQKSFESWTGEAQPRTPKKRSLVPDFKQLMQQAVGCITSKVAHVEGNSFLDVWIDLGRKVACEANKAVELKRLKLAAAARVGPSVHESEIPF